ncbi:hypothetical protein [Maritimibacter dapengensis]|uniref:Uncharacterized protein n=1 Tax=Maritimibacter dapengensis TaxID=2836868 RepID=A0ABS6SWP5_9RHOB|nr:hypothetical protein [Maritimibacter dapengensis]MBV7377389.1 hypothetical protein [Maritimibacter dapengensis]
MQNNVIDFTAYKSAKTTSEVPAKPYTDNVVSLTKWKATAQQRQTAILSHTDVLISGGYAA